PRRRGGAAVLRGGQALGLGGRHVAGRAAAAAVGRDGGQRRAGRRARLPPGGSTVRGRRRVRPFTVGRAAGRAELRGGTGDVAPRAGGPAVRVRRLLRRPRLAVADALRRPSGGTYRAAVRAERGRARCLPPRRATAVAGARDRDAAPPAA